MPKYTVVLTQATQHAHFPLNFFPRKVYYHQEAKQLIESITFLGGQAKIEKGWK